MICRTFGRVVATAAGLALASSTGLGVAVAVTAPPPTPTVQVVNDPFPDDVIANGAATFKVEGVDWPANTLVQLEVCGNEARSGSSDCALDSAQIVASDATGVFRARVSVVVPPSACPCVVRAVSQATGVVSAAPVDIPGAPIQLPGDANVVTPAMRRLDVQSVFLEGSDSFSAWLGGHPQRALEFTVVNSGDVALTEAAVSLTVGPSDDPTGFVPPVSLGRLEVHEKRTYRIPVEFDAISFGKQVVKGTITGTTEQTTFTASTTSYPWLLIAIPIVCVIQLVLLLVRNLARRRLHRNEPPDQAASKPEPDSPAPTAAAAVAGAGGDELEGSTEDPDVEPEPAPELVPMVDTPEHGYADDCIICVIEFVAEHEAGHSVDRNLTVVRGLEATKLALRDTLQISNVSTSNALGLAQWSDETFERVPDGVIDVVSILGVDRATVRQAHEASVDLGHWIEREIGLTLYVTNGHSAGEQLFRCDGESRHGPTFGWNGSEESYTSIFFSGQTSHVDLHGLIPLAVYSRGDPRQRVQPRQPTTDVDGTEGRKILSLGDFLDELLARGEVDDSPSAMRGTSTVGELAGTKNGDPQNGSPSVSSEPPENTS